MHSNDKASTTERREALSTHIDRRGIPSATHRKARPFVYQVYGLTVESEIELPELVPVENHQPQVQIRFGEIPETLHNVIEEWPWCMASDTEFLFHIEGVAKFYITQGRTITIERHRELPRAVPAADIRLWLLGTAFAALLHQRNLLPLHVSAVRTPNGVWAFTGESGEGKSTLAGLLHRRFGHELVSDDVSVIDPDENEPIIYPGPRKLKLWADALDHLDFNGCKMVRDLSNTEKFQIYLTSEGKYQPESLHGLVVLESAPDDATATVERLHGIDAFNVGLCATYRPFMTTWFKRPDRSMMEISNLCQKTRIYRYRRPRCLVQFEKNMEPLITLINKVDA